MSEASLADRLDAVTRAAADAESATSAAAKALEIARHDEASARERFDAEGEDAIDDAAKSRLRRERAERLLATMREHEEAAREAVAVLEQEGRRALYQRAIERANAWPSTIRHELAELIALDRSITDVVGRLTDKMLEADDAYQEAERLAAFLGDRTFAAVQRPALASARLVANVAIAQDRERADREGANDWLASAERPEWPADPTHYDQASASLAAQEN